MDIQTRDRNLLHEIEHDISEIINEHVSENTDFLLGNVENCLRSFLNHGALFDYHIDYNDSISNLNISIKPTPQVEYLTLHCIISSEDFNISSQKHYEKNGRRKIIIKLNDNLFKI